MKRTKKLTDILLPIENLQEYVRNQAIRKRAGWIGGKWLPDGRFYTEKEFDEMFPDEIRYSTVQVDSTKIKQ